MQYWMGIGYGGDLLHRPGNQRPIESKMKVWCSKFYPVMKGGTDEHVL